VAIADDTHGWERLLRVRERPATIVLGTTGEIVWRNDGRLSPSQLTKAFREHLSPGGVFRPRLLKSHLRPGAAGPDFLIPTGEAGEGITLQMLAGRAVILVFWKSSSKPSLKILAELREVLAQPGVQAPAILAIHDGEDTASEMRFTDSSILVVPDPDRAIAAAYGVDIWPTVISLDEAGSVRSIQSGLTAEDQGKMRRENENPRATK
jgi:peroxiredoxin